MHHQTVPPNTITTSIQPHHHNDDEPLLSPALPIPSRAISVVEHPCIIKNVDKGIASLGGPNKLSKGLRYKLEPSTNLDSDDDLPNLISVSLRPDDPFAKRLLSAPTRANGLLLKVTVPKRTGRTRKRGSSGPFLPAADVESDKHGAHSYAASLKKTPYEDASTIFRSLQDNESTYKITPVGIIDETHRFRSLPDLQCASVHNKTMTGIRDHLLPFRYSQLKSYNLNTAAGADLTQHVAPSADFLQMPVAYNYRFQQNPYVKYTDDKGEVNIQRGLAFNGYTIIKTSAESVPTGPKATLPPESSLTPYLQSLIAEIRGELEVRPIITRHLLYNKLGWDRRDRLRQAAVYCGFFFESGPWREALVKWGLDPRKSPEYRKYQTVSFLSYLKTGTARHAKFFDQHLRELRQMSTQQLETQHTFDGVNVSVTGNLFQFCDISDPIIRRILDTTDIRSTCAPTFQGWYHVGTWAKATVILKDKMNKIIGGETPDNSIYERILAWPENWEDKDIYATYREEVIDRQVHKEKAKEHEVMHSVRWAARNPRYAFEKLEALDKRVEQKDSEAAAEELEDVEVPEDMTEAPDTAEAILNEGEGALGEDEEFDESEEDRQGDDLLSALWEPQDASYDSGSPAPSVTTASEGPLPFGGLYNV